MKDSINISDVMAQDAVELANNLAAQNPDSNLAEIAEGLLAGAVHYWLFANKPCGNPRCDNCAPISTPQARVMQLSGLIDQLARNSDYYDSPDDLLAGRA